MTRTLTVNDQMQMWKGARAWVVQPPTDAVKAHVVLQVVQPSYTLQLALFFLNGLRLSESPTVTP